MLDIITDALLDTLRLLPFLYLTYLAMEFLEHKTEDKVRIAVERAGHMGPLIGGMLGVVPQCGFSTAGSSLYAGRVISLGTLFAIYLSTSDEMLPIFISSPDASWDVLSKILLLKLVIGVLAGFGIDVIRRGLIAHGLLGARVILPDVTDHRILEQEPGAEHIKDLCEQEKCHCEEKNIWISALQHALQVAIFILIINFALGVCFEFLGDGIFESTILLHPVLGAMVAGVIGLIPNCAASVAITQLYLNGAITGGAMLAGLLVGAGVGLLVLIRMNHNWKENVCIIGLLYIIGVVFGLLGGLLL